jgi:hypothetical protein
MPDVTDSPDGAHPHLKLDTVDGHPDGEIRLWVKDRFHVMGPVEARALADALNHLVDEWEARRTSAVETFAVPEPEPEPVELEPV